jgi:hypothetical protein
VLVASYAAAVSRAICPPVGIYLPAELVIADVQRHHLRLPKRRRHATVDPVVAQVKDRNSRCLGISTSVRLNNQNLLSVLSSPRPCGLLQAAGHNESRNGPPSSRERGRVAQLIPDLDERRQAVVVGPATP